MPTQEEVDIFMNQYDLDIEPEYRMLDVSAEMGELAKEILKETGFGEKPVEKNEELVDEIGDLYFSLIALANRLGIDLDSALTQAIEKYKKRIEETGNPGSG